VGLDRSQPVKQATAPTSPSTGVSPPDAHGVARLLTVAMEEDPELGLFLRLAVVLGARRGELCGLKWRDVDLDTGEVFIASGVVRVAGRPLIDKDTKTHAKRRVAVGADTVELLRSYRVRQVQAALGSGASLPPDAYVFSQRVDGSKPASPDGVSHRSSNSPPASACVPASTTSATSWSPNSSPAASTGARSRAGPATPMVT
jgi:integrase